MNSSKDLITQGEVTDIQLTLDLLGKALADHKHKWKPVERKMYELAQRNCKRFQKKII